METENLRPRSTFRPSFLNFLRGMETMLFLELELLVVFFLNFLRGMETCEKSVKCSSINIFLNFLRGMETVMRRSKGRRQPCPS